MAFNPNLVITGLPDGRSECPILDNPARMDRLRRMVRPKNTTAFRRTQTVCIVFCAYVKRGRCGGNNVVDVVLRGRAYQRHFLVTSIIVR